MTITAAFQVSYETVIHRLATLSALLRDDLADVHPCEEGGSQ